MTTTAPTIAAAHDQIAAGAEIVFLDSPILDRAELAERQAKHALETGDFGGAYALYLAAASHTFGNPAHRSHLLDLSQRAYQLWSRSALGSLNQQEFAVDPTTGKSQQKLATRDAADQDAAIVLAEIVD